jgi:hypothetical protein
MSWSTLTAAKGSSGSIATWINYSKLDTETVLDEAQSLIFSMLRCREMRTEWTFGMPVSGSAVAIPSRFLDPMGRLYDVTNGVWLGHHLENGVVSLRTYDSTVQGSFGANPFTTTAGLSTINVNQPNHGINQGSIITIAGATQVDVFTPNGTFPVTNVIDVNDFTIDTIDTLALTAVTGGGSAATYTCDNLYAGAPSRWSIWNEQLQFDTAHDTATNYKQLYYRAPQLLSAANPTNFLTNRYPKLIRVATNASAADFMKDDEEYQKGLTALTALIQSISVEQDFLYRGADIGLDVPGGSGSDYGYGGL